MFLAAIIWSQSQVVQPLPESFHLTGSPLSVQQLSESSFCILPNPPPWSSHWFALQNNCSLSHRITCLPNCRLHGGISYPFCPCWCTYFLKLSFTASLRLLLVRLSTGVRSAGWEVSPELLTIVSIWRVRPLTLDWDFIKTSFLLYVLMGWDI